MPKPFAVIYEVNLPWHDPVEANAGQLRRQHVAESAGAEELFDEGKFHLVGLPKLRLLLDGSQPLGTSLQLYAANLAPLAVVLVNGGAHLGIVGYVRAVA